MAFLPLFPHGDTQFSKSNVDANHVSPKKITSWIMSAVVRSRPGAQKQCSQSIMRRRECRWYMMQKWRLSYLCFRESNIKPAPSSYQPSHLTLLACTLQNERSSPVMRNSKYSGLLGMLLRWSPESPYTLCICAREKMQ